MSADDVEKRRLWCDFIGSSRCRITTKGSMVKLLRDCAETDNLEIENNEASMTTAKAIMDETQTNIANNQFYGPGGLSSVEIAERVYDMFEVIDEGKQKSKRSFDSPHYSLSLLALIARAHCSRSRSLLVYISSNPHSPVTQHLFRLL